MDAKQAKGMQTFHERFARAARTEASKPENERHQKRLLRDAKDADKLAAKCRRQAES